MGKLIIGDKHVGASGTAADMRLHACWRTAKTRSRLGCDEMPKAGDDDGDVGPELLKLLADKLEASDFATAMRLLMEAGLSVDDSDVPASSSQTFAEDAMFPHANRLKKGFAGFDPRGASKSAHNPSAADDAEYNRMFPNAGRLK